MKHLRRFNESIDQEDLNDILLELRDMDFKVSGSKPLRPGATGFDPDHEYYRVSSITRDKSGNGTPWKDLKDCVLRIKNYIGDHFVRFYYKSGEDTLDRYKTIELNENTEIEGTIAVIIIMYTL